LILFSHRATDGVMGVIINRDTSGDTKSHFRKILPMTVKLRACGTISTKIVQNLLTLIVDGLGVNDPGWTIGTGEGVPEPDQNRA
jgi:hypothetical protein